MSRFYAPYTDWEDFKCGMWRKVTPNEERTYLQSAIIFTGDWELYGSWMLKVATKWPISTKHNLTNIGMNRKAWIGHAATLLAINCPEYITRVAWCKLSEEQQINANRKADEAIYIWESQNQHLTYVKEVFGR